ncbi:MAG: HEAT repeat domain-containing protein [Cyclobacteriaceae bacterium]
MKFSDQDLLAYLEGESNDRLRGQIELALQEDLELKTRLDELESVQRLLNEGYEYNLPRNVRPTIVKPSARLSLSWLNIAAAVLILITGYALGFVNSGSDKVSNLEMAELKAQVAELQQGSMINALHTPTASQRIGAVRQIATEKTTVSPELLAVLVRTMKNDDSPNVRYAAVQALGSFMDNENVRLDMIKSLEEQSDPLVQIAMIQLLVAAEERKAINSLEQIIRNEQSIDEVKAQAKLAVDILM